MKGLLRSKVLLSLAALIMIAAAVFIPLSGNILHSRAAPSSSQASWSIVPGPNADGYLNGVSVVSANDVWAVGTRRNTSNILQTLIEHWDGTTWSVVASPNAGTSINYLYGVTALSANDIWAVGGGSGETLIEHWDGSSWSIIHSPNPAGGITTYKG